MAQVRMNQIIAVVTNEKSKTQSEIDKLFTSLVKDGATSGLIKKYKPKDEEGEVLPDERKNVQVTTYGCLKEVADKLVSLFDAVFVQESGNTKVTGDIVLPDAGIQITDVPVTYLLFLEREITGLIKRLQRVPTLDPAYNWEWDANTFSYKSEPMKTNRSKKVIFNHVKAEATDRHPAQVEVMSRDEVAGTWETTLFSGAIPEQVKREMLERAESLKKAIVFAREEANSTPVEQKKISREILDFLLPSK